jgi:DNA segregation ATPase FtsK/SpoIIIE, S-DNA-T family
MSGKIGNMVVNTLEPFIGFIGLGIFVFIGLFLSFILLFENFQEKVFKNISINKKKDIEFKYIGEQKYNIPEDKIEDNNSIENDKNNNVIELVKEVDDNNSMEINKDNNIIELVDIDDKDDIKIIKKDISNRKKNQEFKIPDTSLLEQVPEDNKKSINKKIDILYEIIDMFKADESNVNSHLGPIVTTFEFKLASNIDISELLKIKDKLISALKISTIRILPSTLIKDGINIEVPNKTMETIYIKDLLENELFKNSISLFTIILGKDTIGNIFLTDLKKLPHILITSNTNNDKSAGLNSIILSLLYKNSPDNLKLILIDTNMSDFLIYNDIPHLLTPIVNKPYIAIDILINVLKEMIYRHRVMSDTKTTNIENYNEKAKEKGYEPFPYIVIVINELSTLMTSRAKEVETAISQIAQTARSSGIHLIVATKHPSNDVVTKLIKANLASQIHYKIDKEDNNLLLDKEVDTSDLIGDGDSLFTPPNNPNSIRIHAPKIKQIDILNVVKYLIAQEKPEYNNSMLKKEDTPYDFLFSNKFNDELDPLFEKAKDIIKKDKKTSNSYLEEKLGINNKRAIVIIEQLETMGILSKQNTKGNREIL